MKRKKSYIIILSAAICAVFILCIIVLKLSFEIKNISGANNVIHNSSILDESIKSERKSAEDNKKQENDSYYKLFYGEWKCSEIISGGRFFNDAKLEEILHLKILFSEQLIILGDEIVSDEPKYNIALIPTDNWLSFIGESYMPDDISDIIDLERDFFVAIIPSRLSTNEQFFSSLFIIDDETVILKTEYGYVRLLREKHLDNYLDMIPPI